MSLLFFGGVRTSTLALGALFVAVGFALPERRGRALLALGAWFFGFESFDLLAGISAAAIHAGPSSVSTLAARWLLLLHDLDWYLAGPLLTFVAWRLRVRPDVRLVALTAALWIGWFATGWHANGHSLAGFDPVAEAWNEATKTAWGLAYLVPLVRESLARHRA